MPKKKSSKKRRSPEEAALICERIKLRLLSTNRAISDKAILEEEQTSLRLDITLPSEPRVYMYHLANWLLDKWMPSRLALEARCQEVLTLPPEIPLPHNRGIELKEEMDKCLHATFSPEEIQRRNRLLVQVDNAIVDFVGINKKALFSHPLVTARIEAAVLSDDNEFFGRLASAVRRRTGDLPHGNVPLSLLEKAGELLRQGKTVRDVYDRLFKEGEIGAIEPQAVRKLLQRHGVILPKKQKSSRVTKGKKIYNF